MPHTTRPASVGERLRKTSFLCPSSPSRLFGCVSLTCLDNFWVLPCFLHPIRSFVPPFPPVGLPDLPRHSPPSSVLWSRTIPSSPSPAVSGCPRPPVSSLPDACSLPGWCIRTSQDPVLCCQVNHTRPCRRRLEGFPRFLESPCDSVPRARDSGGS